MTRLTRIAAVVALGTITLGFAACGGKDELPKVTAEAPKAATPFASGPLIVTGVEYAFGVEGQPVPGIQTITFRNAGKEYHELQLVSLDPGYALADAQKILTTPGASIPDWVKFSGGIWAIPAGAQGTMTAKLSAGSYAVLCLLEDSNRPWSQTSWRAGEGSKRAPHFARGMVNTFEVKGTEVKDAAPTATLSVESSDYAFRAPSEATAGTTTISLKNNSKEPHFAGLVRVPDGVTYEAFTAVLLAPLPSTDQAVAVAVAAGVSGGVGGVSAGGQAWITTQLRSGTYVIVCLIPDVRGVPHAALGMLNKLTVK